MANKEARNAVASTLSTVLARFGGADRRCGMRDDDLDAKKLAEFDATRGVWFGSIAAKPPRFIVQIERDAAGNVTASFPSDRVGYVNTSNQKEASVLGAYFRVIAAVKADGAQSFLLHEKWEWLLYFCVAQGLASGHSGQTFDGFDPTTGNVNYQEKTLPYVAAGLVRLVDPSDDFFGTNEGQVFADAHPPLTYQMATDAIQQAVVISPTLAPVAAVGEDDE